MSRQAIRSILIVLGLVLLAYIVLHIAFASAESAKGDQPCTGFETAGRCADKGANAKCQYPFRDLNPDGTCDNTDPADPAQVVKPAETTTQNVPDTELPQFQVDNSVDSGENFVGK